MTDINTTSTGNTEGWFWIIGIICFFGLIYRIFGGEREGYVNNVGNCQQEIIIKDVFYNRIFRRFICEYNKTDAGDIIYGDCYKAKFDNNGNCTKLISYEKEPYKNCPNGQYLDGYGKCICDSSSQSIRNGKCYDKCGTNAYYNYSDSLCYCNAGYVNDSNNQCVKPTCNGQEGQILDENGVCKCIDTNQFRIGDKCYYPTAE